MCHFLGQRCHVLLLVCALIVTAVFLVFDGKATLSEPALSWSVSRDRR
jgi:hypothetical protein